jgi:hypothetical protein
MKRVGVFWGGDAHGAIWAADKKAPETLRKKAKQASEMHPLPYNLESVCQLLWHRVWNRATTADAAAAVLSSYVRSIVESV